MTYDVVTETVGVTFLIVVTTSPIPIYIVVIIHNILKLRRNVFSLNQKSVERSSFALILMFHARSTHKQIATRRNDLNKVNVPKRK